MADAEMLTARSPLAGVANQGDAPASDAVSLSEMPFVGKLILRGDSGDKAFLSAVSGVTGMEPPTTPNTASEAGETAILWLGPDEWWIITAPGAEFDIADKLRTALSNLRGAAVTDQTDAFTTLRLTGSEARTVLEKGCAIDLHPRAFTPGKVVRTALALCDVTLWQRDDTPGYAIFVRSSFAPYAWTWLVDASLEFTTSG